MTGFSTSKRSLFRRLVNNNSEYLRPPWAIDEYNFVDSCKNCNACIDACPENIIQMDSRKQPIINFQTGECTFCGDCLSVCDTGALLKPDVGDAPWKAKVTVGSNCLSEKNIHCRSCGDVCEYQALHFPLSIQGIISPEINLDNCNGCGACIAICPTQALKVCYPN